MAAKIKKNSRTNIRLLIKIGDCELKSVEVAFAAVHVLTEALVGEFAVARTVGAIFHLTEHHLGEELEHLFLLSFIMVKGAPGIFVQLL